MELATQRKKKIVVIACFSYRPPGAFTCAKLSLRSHSGFYVHSEEEVSCVGYSAAKKSRHATSEYLYATAKSRCRFLDLSCPVIWTVFVVLLILCVY